MIRKLKLMMPWMVVGTELSHIFCCVLPTLVTVFAVIVNAGLLTATPVFLTQIHDVVHDYEMPLIIFSGFMMLISWAVYMTSQQAEVDATSCGHSSCVTKKNKNLRILQIATLLFFMNLLIYFGIHKNAFNFALFSDQEITHLH